FLSRLC
ncbi:Lipid II flippase FtsW, partial [Haemophilus influenzae]